MINGTGDPYRILVTGWRFWPRAFSWFVDQMLTVAASWPVDAGRKVIVVDGECPRGGVDLYAHEWTTRELGEQYSERHPAPWGTMGGGAGPQRNTHMVNLGADICLGFPGPLDGTGKIGGTRDCMNKARAAGIQTLEFGWSEQLNQAWTTFREAQAKEPGHEAHR